MQRLVAALWLCLLCAWAPGARAEVTLNQASMRLLDAPADTATTVALPYLWDRAQTGKSGVAEFVFTFDMTALAPEPYGLYAAKIANGYEVTLNGRLIDRFGTFSWPAKDDSKLPRVIGLGHALQQGRNELRIRIRGDAGRQGGLSPLVVGTMAEVQAAHVKVWLWRVPARLGVVIFSALVGAMGLALWLTQFREVPGLGRRRDPLYLMMALAELCWVFRVADSIVETPPLAAAWWSVLSSLALGGWASLTTLFCMELLGWGQARWARAMRIWLGSLCLLGIPAAVAAWVYVEPRALTLWYGALGLSFLLFSVAFARRSLFQLKELGGSLFALAIVINVVVGLVDLYLLRVHPSVTGSSALYFSSLLFGLAAATVVLMRFKAATNQAAHLQASLAQQVADKEQELKATYARMSELVHQQARSAERTRILRDMHDGVGMHLSVALRQLQSGQANTDDVAVMLQEGLDQLKLSIDALHLPPGDVTALLANLRYRLEPRLKASGVDLQWQVDMLPLRPQLDDPAMRHLLFMVYESVSNVLQHAQASQLRIEAAQTAAGVRISLTDNGVGFDTQQAPRKGLLSMRERAQAIGAQLAFDSQPGRTVVAILIP